jgi:uncharacterized protein (TIGR02302 family)
MAPKRGSEKVLNSLRWPLRLTWAGMCAERLVRSFWPAVSVAMLALATLMLGLHDLLPVEVVWTGAVLTGLAGLAAVAWGGWTFRMPRRAEALARLDETLQGRPIATLLDDPAIGTEDAATMALWRAHQARMAERAADAKPARPDLNVAAFDPYALRYVAMLALAVALLFGSVWRVGSVAEMAPGSAAAASGPSWEGWIEPPRYTGLPTLYLNDQNDSTLALPAGSRITLRFYGQVGDLTLAETVSDRTGTVPPAAEPHQDFRVESSGTLRIDGPGGREWRVEAIPDLPPQIAIAGPAEARPGGTMALGYAAEDDYGVTGGEVRIELDLDAIDRRFGLAAVPENLDPVLVDLPLPISGDRRIFTAEIIEEFSSHPWANLPVVFTLSARDASGQTGQSAPVGSVLPARNFFDPLAAAIIELRRDLLWSRENARSVSQLLRAVSHRPEGFFRSNTTFLRLRTILRRLETYAEFGLTTEQRDELAQAMWELALKLEDGDISDALERMRQAQERLSQAMKNGASDSEIAELMQELRDATQDYLRQLSRQAEQQNGNQSPQSGENSMQMTQDDLQEMMDRIQELMEQGRMAEAAQALQELQELMENMRVTQGQGQNGQSPGEQAMEGLAETLREQQGLSDQAFRDLQEQFNPDAQAGESQGNEGRNGGLGRGQSHDGQGQGTGEGSSEGAQPGNRPGSGQGEQELADRQRALREELQRQQQGLPGAGTPEGDAARESLGRAGEAMDQAEDALRNNEYADAIDRQAQAMEALREGMRSLGEAMAQQQQQPGQGSREGAQQAQRQDPLGRNTGRGGSMESEEDMLQGDDVYRRARDLLDEIRRRSGEGDRPEAERNYLQRLLDRF